MFSLHILPSPTSPKRLLYTVLMAFECFWFLRWQNRKLWLSQWKFLVVEFRDFFLFCITLLSLCWAFAVWGAEVGAGQGHCWEVTYANLAVLVCGYHLPPAREVSHEDPKSFCTISPPAGPWQWKPASDLTLQNKDMFIIKQIEKHSTLSFL